MFSIVIILTLLYNFSYAQTDSIPKKNSLIIEGNFEYGGILAAGELRDKTFNGAYYSGFNIRVGWRITASSDVHFKLYNNPTYGIGLYSSTFHTDIVGRPNAIYGFVQTPFGNINNKKWAFDYRIGLGLSGNFKPFNQANNPLNLALGTKNNVFIDFGLRSQYKINNHFRAGLGISYHHFSNGALRLPNKGINIVPVSVSLTYQPDGKKITKDTSYTEPVSKNMLYHINVGAGLKQIARESDKRYFKSTLSFYASKHITYKWRVGGGVDLFYSASGNNEEIAEDETGKLGAKISGGPSLYIVHVLNNRLVLNGNVGYYIHNQEFNGESQKIFLRAGFRYYVYKNINAGVSIKAHQGNADFIEWTLGYTFKR
ncbi:acyloxyacyl hydrolase [Sphingobacterium rhinopitheci]|nr:acyloxyacyl hydrolase [Sphingobacterium rhinopitheci]